MFSGKIIFNFGIAERLRTLRYSIFTGRGRSRERQVQHRFLRKRGAAGSKLALSVTPNGVPAPPKGEVLLYLPEDAKKLPPSGELSPQVTERVSLRTLPKKAGNISLTLREWGLFCIESRLQGASGV